MNWYEASDLRGSNQAQRCDRGAGTSAQNEGSGVDQGEQGDTEESTSDAKGRTLESVENGGLPPDLRSDPLTVSFNSFPLQIDNLGLVNMLIGNAGSHFDSLEV